MAYHLVCPCPQLNNPILCNESLSMYVLLHDEREKNWLKLEFILKVALIIWYEWMWQTKRFSLPMTPAGITRKQGIHHFGKFCFFQQSLCLPFASWLPQNVDSVNTASCLAPIRASCSKYLLLWMQIEGPEIETTSAVSLREEVLAERDGNPVSSNSRIFQQDSIPQHNGNLSNHYKMMLDRRKKKWLQHFSTNWFSVFGIVIES